MHMHTDAAAVDDRYWKWLADSAAVAGWQPKEAGAWSGALAGDLNFVLQARGKGTGERGAPFLPNRVPLTDAAAGWTESLRRASGEAARGRRVEVVFQPVGDHPLLLVDDLKPGTLGAFDGWCGVAVLETSPMNLQVSLMAPRVLRGDEVLAVQRALARRCGLTLAAVTRAHLRRVPGSINHKQGLAEPFLTRLFCDPVAGTITHEQLAELLAADAAAVAASGSGGSGNVHVDLERKPGAGVAGSMAGGKPSRGVAANANTAPAPDPTGSGKDWAWIMGRLESWRPPTDEQLHQQLAERAAARCRQGKQASDADHQRYAKTTLASAKRALLAKRLADAKRQAKV
ncbi:MAG: DNA-primase RepB domain-containing protein [Pseudomonadota bacterium]